MTRLSDPSWNYAAGTYSLYADFFDGSGNVWKIDVEASHPVPLAETVYPRTTLLFESSDCTGDPLYPPVLPGHVITNGGRYYVRPRTALLELLSPLSSLPSTGGCVAYYNQQWYVRGSRLVEVGAPPTTSFVGPLHMEAVK